MHKIIEEGQQNKREVWLDVAKLVHKTEQVRERKREKKEVVYTAYLIGISMPVCLWKTKYLFIKKKKVS